MLSSLFLGMAGKTFPVTDPIIVRVRIKIQIKNNRLSKTEARGSQNDFFLTLSKIGPKNV